MALYSFPIPFTLPFPFPFLLLIPVSASVHELRLGQKIKLDLLGFAVFNRDCLLDGRVRLKLTIGAHCSVYHYRYTAKRLNCYTVIILYRCKVLLSARHFVCCGIYFFC